MTSPADRSRRGNAARLELLDGLRRRLETADELTRAMRDGMARADAAAVESATSRLETVLLEYKLLAQEYASAENRDAGLPLDGPRTATDLQVEQAKAALQETATRIARSSAIAGGLLERMVALNRGLVQGLGGAAGTAYLPSGQSTDHDACGLRLTEQA